MANQLAASERYNNLLKELSSVALPPLPHVERKDLRDTAFTVSFIITSRESTMLWASDISLRRAGLG